jgi:putative FmdB family regulatory protein
MPIYEYSCNNCGTFELSRRITDSPLRRCPTCKGKVRKLISSTSFQLKGSGWYVTDYAGKKDGGPKKAKEDGKPESPATKESTDSSTSAKSETKPTVTAA